jgi:spore germination protein YaaH
MRAPLLPLVAALALATLPATASATAAATDPFVAAPDIAGPLAHTSRAARTCAKPTHVTFSRPVGRTTGVLRWKASAPVRVLRNGRIAGQTTRHALRIAVKLGRTYRFAVVPLSPAGRPQRCRAGKRVRIAYRAPGAPRQLTVQGDERGLQLSWRPGPRGDGAPAGYRLRRGDATLGQTRQTGWRLAAAPNRAYRFTVVAVDSRGRESAPSNAVTAATGHAPPTTPQGVQALPVSESELGISWQPSSVATGSIRGYRVLRDGVIVGQVSTTSKLIANLAASTDYHVQVVAIDSLGYASEPSAPITARTQDPIPSSGHAQAYLLASTDQSFEDFRARYRQIGVVYPTYFDCTGGALLEGTDDPLITRWAQARQVDVLPRVNCQRTTTVHAILTDATIRARWLDQLTALVADNGYDGISIDFEAGPAADRTALSTFIETLSARMHAAGKLLTIAVSPKASDSLTHPRSGIFDYPRLAQSADWLFVMAWGLHWATSAPGAQDDAAWATRVADYVATLALKHKFIYGTNLYGMDWPAGGGPANPATAYQYEDIVPRLPQLGAVTQLDPATDNHHATYTDAGGVSHDVWYPDATTTGRRIRMAADRGLGGVGFWRLGLEDQRLWDDPLLGSGATW